MEEIDDRISAIVGDLVLDINMVNDSAQRFILERHPETIVTCRTGMEHVERDLEALQRKMAELGESPPLPLAIPVTPLRRILPAMLLLSDRLAEAFGQYRARFDRIDDLAARIGLDENKGLIGQFRQDAHDLEDRCRTSDQCPLLVSLLQLRRHEKDFMERKDAKYLEKFMRESQRFLAKSTADFVGEESEAYREQADAYFQRFGAVAALILELETVVASFHQIDGELVGVANEMIQVRNQTSIEDLEYQRQMLFYYGILFYLVHTVIYLVIGILTFTFYMRHYHRPVRELSQFAVDIAAGDYGKEIVLDRQDELGRLAELLNRMKEGLRQSNEALQQQVAWRTRKLQETIQDLETTREELAHSAKMASLGRLVAGFAHELNTPVGIAIGTISGVVEQMRELRELLSREEVDGDRLDRLMDNAEQSALLGMANLRRTADLVASFKRISMDRSTEQRRSYNLREVIQDTVASLVTRFKRTAIQIVIECPETLRDYGHPGALNQVLTNLLLNSLIHGFEQGERAGKIWIHCRVDPADGRIAMDVRDDGRGMPPEVVQRIFEPFFTTAGGQGGSGLGLYISYNIVRNQLKGSILCESLPGQGTLFVIRFPQTTLQDPGQE